ncbi:MAG: lipocalin family protein [Saprospiraceae bacterium]|nr:lipocalin family protein [Saprospiraceae bacterium]
MNTVFKSLLFVSLLVGVLSCKKDDDKMDDGGDPLVGRWEIVEAMGTLADANLGTIYTYNSDGTFKLGEGLLSSEGTYERSSTTITMEFSGSSIVFVYDYTLTENRLTLDNTSSDQVFILEKR